MLHHTDRSPTILLVDDEPEILEGAQATLKNAGLHAVEIMQDSRRLLPALNRQEIKIIVLDLFMPHMSGTQLLPKILRSHPDIAIIVMTASQDVDTAVACMKEGAFDYLVKPVEKTRLISTVKKALDIHSLKRQVQTLKQTLIGARQTQTDDAFAGIISINERFRSLFHYIRAVAGSMEPILITGETGVGKELIARAVHRASHRQQDRFVTINAAGLDDTVFSDTLFGHRKGAFTGADKNREGLIAQADNGTLFLDEIGDLSEASQVKLLRLMQENTYYPLGSDVPRKSSARIVLATNRDLHARIATGHFRADLYYRLSVHEIAIPPLRERKDDIPLLTTCFLEEASNAMGKPTPTPPKELFTLLQTYDFPGNVRELRALVFDAVIRHKSRMISMQAFLKVINKGAVAASHSSSEATDEIQNAVHYPARLPTLKESEQLLIREALKRAQNNQGVAATLLGISRQALNRRLGNMFPAPPAPS